jgi:hypothetical protein
MSCGCTCLIVGQLFISCVYMPKDIEQAFAHLDVRVAAERRASVMQLDTMAKCAVCCCCSSTQEGNRGGALIPCELQCNTVLHFMWCRQLQLALCDVLRVRFVKHDDSKYAQPTAMQMVQFCTRMLQFPAHWVRINLEYGSSSVHRHTQRLHRKTAE